MDKKKAVAAATGALAGFATGRMVDLALMGGLVFTAAGAVGFAGYETMINDHKPKVNGMQYLAIFAQPRHHVVDPEKAALDMSPVGALPHAAPLNAGGYSLVGAETRFAWLREGNRIFAVNPGDDVPRLGHVVSIGTHDGRWALLGVNGEILIVGAVAELADPASVRFNKRMIFRGGR